MPACALDDFPMTAISNHDFQLCPLNMATVDASWTCMLKCTANPYQRAELDVQCFTNSYTNGVVTPSQVFATNNVQRVVTLYNMFCNPRCLLTMLFIQYESKMCHDAKAGV